MSEPRHLDIPEVPSPTAAKGAPDPSSMDRFEEMLERFDRVVARVEGTPAPSQAGGSGSGGSHRPGYVGNALIAVVICLGYALYHEQVGEEDNAVKIRVQEAKLKEQREEYKALRRQVDTLRDKVHNGCP